MSVLTASISGDTETGAHPQATSGRLPLYFVVSMADWDAERAARLEKLIQDSLDLCWRCYTDYAPDDGLNRAWFTVLCLAAQPFQAFPLCPADSVAEVLSHVALRHLPPADALQTAGRSWKNQFENSRANELHDVGQGGDHEPVILFCDCPSESGVGGAVVDIHIDLSTPPSRAMKAMEDVLGDLIQTHVIQDATTVSECWPIRVPELAAGWNEDVCGPFLHPVVEFYPVCQGPELTIPVHVKGATRAECNISPYLERRALQVSHETICLSWKVTEGIRPHTLLFGSITVYDGHRALGEVFVRGWVLPPRPVLRKKQPVYALALATLGLVACLGIMVYRWWQPVLVVTPLFVPKAEVAYQRDKPIDGQLRLSFHWRGRAGPKTRQVITSDFLIRYFEAGSNAPWPTYVARGGVPDSVEVDIPENTFPWRSPRVQEVPVTYLGRPSSSVPIDYAHTIGPLDGRAFQFDGVLKVGPQEDVTEHAIPFHRRLISGEHTAP